MDVHSVYGLFLRPFRRRRMQAFERSFRPTESTTILDVGGTPFNWELAGVRSRLTLLNLSPPEGVESLPANYRFVLGSGTQLGFGEGAFDVVFSNSVIEHLASWERQRAFAREVRRVARGLWVQTPARGFPIEPHLMTPFLHYLPAAWQRRLLRNFSLWGLVARPSPQAVDDFLRETRPLGYQEMRELFPDCEIRRERFLGLTKSYVAVRLATEVR
jgi:SAM-dependent methyltransferase